MVLRLEAKVVLNVDDNLGPSPLHLGSQCLYVPYEQ
jgi:hypothetical protein